MSHVHGHLQIHQLATALLYAVSEEVWVSKINGKIISLKEADRQEDKDQDYSYNHPDKMAEGQWGNQQCCLLTYSDNTERKG